MLRHAVAGLRPFLGTYEENHIDRLAGAVGRTHQDLQIHPSYQKRRAAAHEKTALPVYKTLTKPFFD